MYFFKALADSKTFIMFIRNISSVVIGLSCRLFYLIDTNIVQLFLHISHWICIFGPIHFFSMLFRNPWFCAERMKSPVSPFNTALVTTYCLAGTDYWQQRDFVPLAYAIGAGYFFFCLILYYIYRNSRRILASLIFDKMKIINIVQSLWLSVLLLLLYIMTLNMLALFSNRWRWEKWVCVCVFV